MKLKIILSFNLNPMEDLDPEEEAVKPGANEVLWAVVAAYTK